MWIKSYPQGSIYMYQNLTYILHMETYGHELSFSQDAPPDYSHFFNYLDYTFNVKVSRACDDTAEYSARYYWNDEMAGILRFKYSIMEGFNKPIKQKVLLLIDAACDKLIGHVIIDLKVPQDQLIHMSNAIQIHATRKVREFVLNPPRQEEVPQ